MLTTSISIQDAVHAGQLTDGMNFQQRVWALCARVPRGQVVSYGDIARKLDAPAAARAVGNALNRNPYAPAVPCHRVVGGDGSLTGYAGGLERKAAMLAEEGVPMRGPRVDLTRCRFRL